MPRPKFLSFLKHDRTGRSPGRETKTDPSASSDTKKASGSPNGNTKTGNSSSKDTKTGPSPSSSEIRTGILAAVGEDDDLAAFPSNLLYQFEDAKPYNLDIPLVPAAVTYPKTAEQIAAIVKFAAKEGLKVQARSGGHSYANYCIGGTSGAVVVDMKNFQQFSMDKTTFNATIGAGTLLDDVTKRLDAAGGRAIAHGVCPQVGTGGHLTIGGFGPTSRLWGTALDHIIAAQVVLADGSIVNASETEHPDVFFAIKGAAAGFGIVTEFTVRTHPTPDKMIRYSYAWKVGTFRSFATTVKTWFTFISDPALSRKLYTQITLSPLGLIISGTFVGTQAEFDALHLENVFPKPERFEVVELEDWLGFVAHWTEDVGLHLFGGTRCAFYAKCIAFKPADVPSTSVVDALMAYLDATDKGTLLWFLNFELQGGTTNDVPADATAYAHRDVLLYMEMFGIDVGRVSSTTRGFVTGASDVITSASPNVFFGCYPGYVDPELTDGQERYWGSNLPRLMQIKKAIDPNNLFSNPQSVRPAA